MGLTTIIFRATLALVAFAMLRRAWPAAGAAGGPAIAAVWVFAGVYFPDIDLLLPLDHRSILTHSILPVLAMARLGAGPAAAGLSLGMGIHLSADLFPGAWSGFALIQVPLAGSLGPLSPAWILANAVLATVLGVVGLRPVLPAGAMRRVFHAGVAVLAAWYLVLGEGSLLALMVFGAVFAATLGGTEGRRAV